MTGHLDDAEIDQVSPIFSYSLGCSCIFLIGDETKDVRPIALRLDSGDVLVMSGKSRKSYHGVPRILKQSFTGTNT
jgi:alkylated DNA repair protein alkB family protein 1